MGAAENLAARYPVLSGLQSLYIFLLLLAIVIENLFNKIRRVNKPLQLLILFLVILKSGNCQLISTISGNGTDGYNGDSIAAVTAELGSPVGVALDKPGNVYIAEYDNHRIRKITAGSGLITTIAGTGTAGYNGDGIPATSAQIGRGTG